MTTERDGWFDWTPPERRLWTRWTLANGMGEVLGLGLAGLAGSALTGVFGVRPSFGESVAFAVVLITLGTLEGGIVGFAQWYVLRSVLPSIRARAWIGATAAGAFLAWTLGMLPSTMAADDSTGIATEPSLLVVLALAAALGAVAGSILSSVQWLVLRSHVVSSWRWLPANAIAWSVGMVVVFLGVSLLPNDPLTVTMVLLVLGTAGTAGLVVGAIHGIVLVRIVGEVSPRPHR